MGIIAKDEALIKLSDGSSYKISAQDFEVESEVHDPDRDMGSEWVHTFTAYGPNSEKVSWYVYEYPENIINYIDKKVEGCEILEDPKFDVYFDED